MIRILKEALKFLLGLGIMFSSIALALSIFTHTALLNQEFYINSLEKSSYFTYLREEIDNGFNNYSLITSIPKDVFKEAVSDSEIKSLATENIRNTMSYMRYEGDYTDKRIDATGLDTAMKDYASGLTGEASQLSTVTKEAAAIVNSHAVLFDVSRVAKYSQFQSVRQAVFTAYKNVYSIAAVLALMVLGMFLLSRKSAGVFQLWIGGSLLAASLVLLVPSVMGIIFNIPYRFPVENYYLKVALSGFALGYLRNLILSAAVMLLGGIVMLYIGILKVPPLNSKT
jgi:hypothetical protein